MGTNEYLKFKKIVAENEIVTKKQILTTLKISERTYFRYLKKFEDEECNFANQLIKTNIASYTKDEVASFFEISKKTLHFKEKEVFKNLIPFLLMHGISDNQIAYFFKLHSDNISNFLTDITFEKLDKEIKSIGEYTIVLADTKREKEIKKSVSIIRNELKKIEKNSTDIFQEKITNLFDVKY